MADMVFRIQRKADGYWYGKKSHWSGCWHRDEGKYFTEYALKCVLRGWTAEMLDAVQVVRYSIREEALAPATKYVTK